MPVFGVERFYKLAAPAAALVVFFGFSLLLAVATRSTVVCVFGSILFWFVCWGMNYGRHTLVLAQKLAPESSFSRSLSFLAEAGYWILPKPADFSFLLFDALDAQGYFRQQFDFQALCDAGCFSLEVKLNARNQSTGGF